MKLAGWKISNDSDGSVVILLVSKHYCKENTLSRFLEYVEQPSPDDEHLDIAKISITIPPAGEREE